VNCSDFASLARKGQLEQRLGEPEVLAHLRECGACEALYAGGHVANVLVNEAESDIDFDLSAMQAELSSLLDADAKDPTAPLRDLSLRARTALVVGVVVFTALVVWAVWARPDWANYPASRMALTLGALAAVSLLALRELLRPLTLIERPRLQWAWLWVAVLTPFAMALVPHHASDAMQPRSFLGGVGVCLVSGVAMLLPTAICVVLALRAAVGETRGLWLLAGFLGLVGNLALQLHCPYTALSHLLFGHALLSVVWFGGLWLWFRARSVA
jgi:hypothetical protein